MPDMTPERVEWLGRFTGTAIVPPGGDPLSLEEQLRRARVKERAEEQVLKEEMIGAAVQALAPEKERMRDAFDLKVKGQDGKKQNLRDKKGQQEKAYDPYADGVQQAKKRKPRAEPADLAIGKPQDARPGADQSVNEAGEAMDLIVAQRKKLADARVKRTQINKAGTALERKDAPLFTDKEIMDELYTPLVRELIVPETVVPDKYSATQKMIDGSNEFYIKECTEKGSNTGFGLADITDLGKGLVSGIGNAVVGFELAEGASAATLAVTNGVIGLLNLTTDLVVMGASVEFDTTSLTTVAKDLSAAVVGGLTCGLAGTTNDQLKMLPALVGNALTAGIGGILSVGPAVANALKTGDMGALVDDLGLAFSNMIVGALGGATAAVTAQMSGEPQLAAGLSSASKMLQGEIPSLAKACVAARQAKLLAAYRAGQTSKFVTILSGVGTDLAKNMAAGMAVIETAEITAGTKPGADATAQQAAALGAEKTTLTNQVTADVMLAGVSADKAAAVSKALNSLLETREKDTLDYKKKKDAETLANMEKTLDSEVAKFRQSLDRVNTDTGGDPDFKTMATLIKQAEKDKVFWQSLQAMAGLSSSALTLVFPTLNAAGELIEFTVEAALVIKRMQAAYDWYESHRDAVGAVSPYATSIQNMFGNQREQAAQHSFLAASHVVKAALEFAAHFDPHGVCIAVAAGVSAASAAEEAMYKVYKRAALARAWKQTAKALRNPKDRKAALIAREMNPTLAKYTIAYGALIDNDPIALRAVNKIGLDNETLSRADSKVKDVAKYLKELYWEDNVVLDSRAAGIANAANQDKVKPPAAALTLERWAQSLAFWREHRGLAKAESSPGIGRLLGQVAMFAMQTDEARDLKAFPAYLGTLAKLAAAFRAFKAVGDGGGPVDSVREGVKAYVDLAEAKYEAVKLAKEARETDDAAEQPIAA